MRFPEVDAPSASFAKQLAAWCAVKAEAAEKEAATHPDRDRVMRCEGQATVWRAMASMLTAVFVLSVVACGCGWDPCAGLTEPSILCPSGPTASPTVTPPPDVPCGATPCDDGYGGTLQDVGEHCGGDDEHAPLPGVASCCHGLSCVDPATGAFPGSSFMGACSRGSGVPAGAPTCPKGGPWRYQCDGLFTLKSDAMTVVPFTGEFTGPAPGDVTAQGGLKAWMKITFAARFPYITVGGFTYYYLAATNCRPIGPAIP